MNNPSLIYIVIENCRNTPHPSPSPNYPLLRTRIAELTMSLGMSKFQLRSKAQWRGHHTVAESSVAVGRVAGVTLPVPGLSLGVSLRLSLVVTEAVWEVAVGVGGVASKGRR